METIASLTVEVTTASASNESVGVEEGEASASWIWLAVPVEESTQEESLPERMVTAAV